MSCSPAVSDGTCEATCACRITRARHSSANSEVVSGTGTSGVPVPTWPIICAALRAISSRSQNRGKTLRFREQVAWNGKQWWRNAKIGGPAMTLDVHHSWRPSTSENNFLSRNLAEPVADARLCCARAPAHRHAAPRRPRSELLTWQRLRCPKGSCIGKRGEGRWWVRSPANSRTSFSKRQKDYRTIGIQFR